MLGIIGLIAIGAFVYITIGRTKRPTTREVAMPSKTNKKLKQLWGIADKAIKDKKYLIAEKALLNILKIDHKNAAAFNRLGIVYAKQKNLEDAQECFEVASTLAPSPSNLHNLGLIYYEMTKYEKAAIAFERAIDLEPSIPRYMAQAKSYQKLNNMKQVVEVLERARQFDDHPEVLTMLAEAYIIIGNDHAALETRNTLGDVLRTRKQRAPKEHKTQIKHRAGSV